MVKISSKNGEILEGTMITKLLNIRTIKPNLVERGLLDLSLEI